MWPHCVPNSLLPGWKNLVDWEGETDGAIEQAIIEPANPPISIKPWGRHKYLSCPPKLSTSQPVGRPASRSVGELSIKSWIHKLTPSVTLAKQAESWHQTDCGVVAGIEFMVILFIYSLDAAAPPPLSP